MNRQSGKRKEKIEENKFRILVIGRANAGKTTILQQICDSTNNPNIYDAKGEKIPHSVIEASGMSGEHDIEREMVFGSIPSFRFHDSPGFESGSILELDQVKAFIEGRSRQEKPDQRLNAIWYCIPVNEGRTFTAAENAFFSTCDTGTVPVIVIFTKFEALDDEAFDTLRKQNKSRSDAKMEAPSKARMDFEREYSQVLRTKPYPPKKHVYLRDMNEPDADCSELQELLSTQRNSLGLCTQLRN